MQFNQDTLDFYTHHYQCDVNGQSREQSYMDRYYRGEITFIGMLTPDRDYVEVDKDFVVLHIMDGWNISEQRGY